MGGRPEVPDTLAARFRVIAEQLPKAYEEDAWVGVRWRIGKNTICHLFGGEDGLFRVVFRGEPDEVVAFQHMGEPYFRAGWGSDIIGLILNDDTDWDEVSELITMSYCLMAPKGLAAQVEAAVGRASAPADGLDPHEPPG